LNPNLLKRFVVRNSIERQALCNDGSPAIYYFRPSPSNRTEWVIHLQGGSGCTSAGSCAARWGDEGMPNTNRQTSFDFHRMSNCDEPPVDTFEGLLSTDPEKNPDFHDWNLVLVEYCSSDFHNGDAAPDQDHDFYFRGKRNLTAVIEDLQNTQITPRHSLGQATEVLFSGSSAGSSGMRLNLDYVTEMLAHAQVCGVADAALEPESLADSTPARLQRVAEYLGLIPEQSCFEETCNADLCTSNPHVGLHHVQTPYFAQMDQNDSNILARPNAPDPDELASEVRASLAQRTGAFSHREMKHVYVVLVHFTRAPIAVASVDYTYADVLGAWYFDRAVLEDPDAPGGEKPGYKVVILGPQGGGMATGAEARGGMCGGRR
jgi:hypothetical protein